MYVFNVMFFFTVFCSGHQMLSMNSIHRGNNGPNVGVHSASLLSAAVALRRPPQ